MLEPGTGVAGLTLGGSIGYATRRRGWTVDNVTGMEVVTADGEIVRASERDNPDLFWALCGGGGNFGVVRIKSFGQPVGDVLQRRSYTSQQSLVDATQPFTHARLTNRARHDQPDRA
jgi:hypothetical protein